jgi:hypothetical protein
MAGVTPSAWGFRQARRILKVGIERASQALHSIENPWRRRRYARGE